MFRRREPELKERIIDRPTEAARRAWRDARKKLSPSRRRRRERIKQTAAVTGGAAAGAAAAYYLDPDRGKSRRATTRDRLAGGLRRVSRRGGRLKRRVESDAEGFVERVRRSDSSPPPNDVTLAHKVESEILGRPDVPKGSIIVGAADGIVTIRGSVKDPGLIEDLGRQVEEIPGVRGVENLLHMVGTPAPNKQEARRAGTA